jgi:hypothetical protein
MFPRGTLFFIRAAVCAAAPRIRPAATSAARVESERNDALCGFEQARQGTGGSLTASTTATILPLRRYYLQPPTEQRMTERHEDEFADLSGEQEEAVRHARKWVQSMVKEARKSDLHLQMIALEMMTHGLTILTGKDMETARAEVMAMFSEGDGNRLVLRRIRAQASSDTSD